MTGPAFRLSSGWLSAAADASAPGLVEVRFGDLTPRLEALGASAAAELVEVLLAAHVKVLMTLGAEAPGTVRVQWAADGRPTVVAVPARSAIDWREFVRRVARSVRTASPEDRVTPDDGGVLFASTAAAAPGSTAALVIESRADVLAVHTDGRLGEARLHQIAALYRSVLEAMSDDPAADARRAVLAAAERRAVLEVWARGTRLDRGPVTVLELFLRSAAAEPQAAAVRADGRTLSFQELDEQSTRIARLLLERGARPATAVGVCLRRCIDLLPTLLGVWKAGAYYLPLDVEVPPARLREMALAADCGLIVSSSRHRALLGEAFSEATLVLLDEAAQDIAAQSASHLHTVLDPTALAYTLFTSGSTGTPKGVMVHHAGLANYVLWTAQEYAARGTGGSPYLSPIGFDLGVPSLFTPLVVGQRVDLLPDPLDLADLGDLLVRGGPYSFVKLTPGHLSLLSTDLEPAAARDLAGLVIAAGDAFPASLARRWSALAGPEGTPVATEYGPTEITVGNSGQEVAGIRGEGLVPLGAPIPNTTMYVLDDLLDPAPIGVAGEVCVGGSGVAYGYLGAPALTAERFVPDPYGPAGSRLYRTGDSACWEADGALRFLGRMDHQVKIRGYRVEPAEVRAVLQRLEGVQESVAVVRRASGGARLAAFVVPVSGLAPPDPSSLRAVLAAQLPEYMVPESVRIVARIPLTVNGKVDADALFDDGPDGARAGSPLLPSADSRKQVPVIPADSDTYRVVVNDEEQYSIWAAGGELPAGWHATGFEGAKALCLQHIAEIWTDIRPLSARIAAAGIETGSPR